MDNEGVSALPFLFLVPILFVVGCFIYDFIPVFKEKNNLKDNMEYIVQLYEDGHKDQISIYANSKGMKAQIYKESDTKERIELSKEVEMKSPVVKLIFGTPYKVEISKVVEIK